RRAQRHVGATFLERHGEVRRLRGHVEAGREATTGERTFPSKALADEAQHRHGSLRPLGTAPPLGCEFRVLDVGSLARSCGRHALTFLVSCLERCEASRRSSTPLPSYQGNRSTSRSTSLST